MAREGVMNTEFPAYGLWFLVAVNSARAFFPRWSRADEFGERHG
jgi:hypothetical protein